MSYLTPYKPEHVALARALVAETHANHGLAPVDLDRFWADHAVAEQDPWGADIPQVPFGVSLTQECVYAENGVAEDFWRYDHDEDWRIALNKAFNDKAERIVGRRLVSEDRRDPTLQYPPVKGLHDVFEAENIWHDQSWWLTQSAHNEAELEALLDRVERRDIREFILPDNWAAEKQRLMDLGIKPRLYRGQRGPVTFACSIYGPENLMALILLEPDLAARFSHVILNAMLDIARVMDEEAGYTPETAPHGFGFADDNSCLLRPDMYERFAKPILEGIWNRYSPDPGDSRYQHSDSAMNHIVPILGSLGLTGANFGPTVTVAEIRQHCPKAVIHGAMAPFTYCRNEEENIVLEFLRDFDMARATRGLVFATAGSINNGTRLTSMRLAMAAIQRYGRYR
ncbi:MAG TPA: uroporphyrinogen decarboxylase family protein [Candidatus Hydrogenedentes bacterium]|nr:uroporphyrinogen decarboxylase family protein [Candidatus Hydrogenedentota bacterium]HPG69495.1 uroporphyrinogen decarboxylase family protein [Candidatus Hydrogenedentota bacterium]